MRKKSEKNEKESEKSQGNFIINLINGKTARYDVFGENYSSPYFLFEIFILPAHPGEQASYTLTYLVPTSNLIMSDMLHHRSDLCARIVHFVHTCTYLHILIFVQIQNYWVKMYRNVQKLRPPLICTLYPLIKDL